MTTTAGPTLRWPITASFFEYIQRLSDGEVSVLDGAVSENATFVFPSGGEVGGALVATAGAVRCTGHHGMLVIEFRDLSIAAGEGGLIVTMHDEDAPDNRLAFARLGELALEGSSVRAKHPTLTEDGSDLFFGNYRPGAPLDALTLQFDTASAAAAFIAAAQTPSTETA